MPNLRQGSLGAPHTGAAGSPKLPQLPRKGSRNVYMQKKGLVLNHRDLGPSAASTGPSRNPFTLHTERLRNSNEDYPTSGVQGVGLTQPPPKFDTAAKKPNIMPQTSKAHHKQGGNPFSGGGSIAPGREARPDSMISGGRSPDDSMMYQNKFNH